MKKIIYTFLSLMFAVSANAQLTNNGATIVVETGATLVVESNITNSGTMTNSGTIIVEGDFDNTGGTLTSTASTSKIVFTGTDPATLTLDAATTVYEVEMDKTANNVTLNGNDLTVTNDLHFVKDNNKFDVNGNKLTIGAAGSTTIDGAVTGSYIIADGNASATSLVSKEVTADETFTYEIGDATNYTPLEAVITGSGYSAAALDVNTVGMKQANVPTDADDFINRYWNVDQAGITDPSITLTGTYVAGDLESGATAADVKGAHYTGSDWTYLAAAAGTNEVTGTIEESGDFTGTNRYGKLNITAFLQGAYDSGMGEMLTDLTSLGSFPLTSPYLDAPATVTTVPADVVDWVKLELRDPTDASIVQTRHSAFITKTGLIVGVDGNSLLLKDANASAIVSLHHRNHLAIRTSAALSTVAPTTTAFDFSTSGAQAYDNTSVANSPMVDLGTGVFGLFSGDTNGDGYIRYTDAFIPPFTFINSDALAIFSTLGNSSNAQLQEYNNSDVNFDGYVRYTDAFIPPFTFINSDALAIFSTLGNSSSAQLQNNL